MKQDITQYLTDLLEADMGMTLLYIGLFGIILLAVLTYRRNRKITKYNEAMKAYYSSPEYLAAVKAQREKEAQEMETINWILKKQLDRNR